MSDNDVECSNRTFECTEEKKKVGRSAVLIAEARPAPHDRASSEALEMGLRYYSSRILTRNPRDSAVQAVQGVGRYVVMPIYPYG